MAEIKREERINVPIIGWQLGLTGELDPAMGCCVDQDIRGTKEDHTFIGGTIPNVIGFFGAKAAGPFLCGETPDKHGLGIGRTKDGELQCAGHLST